MAQALKKGDKVRWRSGGGRAAGTVERVITGRGKVGGRTVTGSKSDPRYVVKNAETGKTVVLKRPSLQKTGARAAQSKAAKGKATKGRKTAAKGAGSKSKRTASTQAKPEPEPPAATAAEAETAVMSRPASDRRRWIAAGGIAAGVALIVAIIALSSGGDDDDGGDDAAVATEATTTEATTTTTPATSGDVSAALAARPLAIEGVGAIVAERLGDDQEAQASQFERTYSDALAGLGELERASAGDETVSALAAYVTSEVEVEQAITNAFVRNSFSDGDPPSVLAQKTTQTTSALRAQMRKGSQLDAPPEASELQRAFSAARRANLTYLEDVAAAIDAGDQGALDQALSDGRAAATAAGRRIDSAAAALQGETEASAGAS